MKKYLLLVAIMSSFVFGAEDPHFVRVAQAIVAARMSDERKEDLIDTFCVISNMLTNELIAIANVIEQSCSADDLLRFNQALKCAQEALRTDTEHVQRSIKLFHRFFAYEARLLPALKPYVDQLEKEEQKSFQGLSPEVYRARVDQQSHFNDTVTLECNKEVGKPLQRAIDAIHHKSFFIKWDNDNDSDEIV